MRADGEKGGRGRERGERARQGEGARQGKWGGKALAAALRGAFLGSGEKGAERREGAEGR